MAEENLNEKGLLGNVRHLSVVKRWQRGWRKDGSPDGTYANVYDADGCLVEIEYYNPTGEYCGKCPLVNTRIETPDGKLIVEHITQRMSEDAYDIHVLDEKGNLRVVLHHSDVNCDGPNTIKEDWV
jgi:hypothetical protein